MSKIALSPNAAGTGTFTIAAPNSNTNRTLTLPDLAGTVLTDASSLLAANLTGDVAAARITNALNATGSAPIYACRAWVNFDGTLSGTIAPRASANISSVSKTGTGTYTLSFSANMPDANYVVAGTHRQLNASGGGSQPMGIHIARATTPAAGSVTVESVMNTALSDSSFITVAIFR
jgi:hypothetical protein